MKIYTLAKESNECYGHGDYGTEEVIRKAGCYGTGEFHPCFRSQRAAIQYLKHLKQHVSMFLHVVSLELKG